MSRLIPTIHAVEDQVQRQCELIDRLVERGHQRQVPAAREILVLLEHSLREVRKSAILLVKAER